MNGGGVITAGAEPDAEESDDPPPNAKPADGAGVLLNGEGAGMLDAAGVEPNGDGALANLKGPESIVLLFRLCVAAYEAPNAVKITINFGPLFILSLFSYTYLVQA